MREQGIRIKYNPLTDVAGKRVVIVDDSIVRGSTTRQIVAMLLDAGAAEVHVRISSPPDRLAVLLRDRLRRHGAARRGRRAPSRRCATQIGATSLAYLSLDGLQAATQRPASRSSAAPASRASTRRRIPEGRHAGKDAVRASRA